MRQMWKQWSVESTGVTVETAVIAEILSVCS